MTTVANEHLLFVHIPKTGGTWAMEAMVKAGVEFEPIADDHHPEYPDLPRDRFTFAFVRDPVSWYRSLWSFHRREPQRQWENLSRWIDLALPDFLERIAIDYPGWLARYYRLFVGPPEDEIDFVGRNEHLRDDLVRALRLAGQDFDEDVIRTFPARNFRDEETLYGTLDPPKPRETVPAEIAARIAESEREVYERFYDRSDDQRLAKS